MRHHHKSNFLVTVCPYPIGVILSIAQGWQVQRSLPWVTMQARRLPWGKSCGGGTYAIGIVLFKINLRLGKSFANNPFAACGNDVR